MSALYVQQWAEADWSKNLTQRLADAKQYRKDIGCDDQWVVNEKVYYHASLQEANGLSYDPTDLEGLESDELEMGLREVAINYVFRDVRYMHAQMSANPPSIKVIPNSTDLKDEESSDAADMVARWGAEHYDFQELHDQRNLKTLTKGTGYIRGYWDNTLGRIINFDVESGALTLEGDMRFYSPSSWDIWLDPDARCADPKSPTGIKWFFELVTLSKDEACMRWPKHKKKFEELAGKPTSKWKFWASRPDAEKQRLGRDKVEIYLYVERGEAVNAMLGRFAVMLEDGTMLDYGINPNPGAVLGLDVLTDIDIEDCPYGKSIIEYLEAVQDLIQTLDANTLRNIAAHGNIRMYVDENTELADEALSNDQLDIIRGKGQAPHFLNPPSQMPDAWRFRDQLKAGGQEISMVNESMLGNMSRETSGYTFQTAISAGNTSRRRLFNKYAKSVKLVYAMLFSMAIKHWDAPKTVKVLGEERAYQSDSFRGADIDGGWDMISVYGQNFSLDPNTARDQIMQLMPLFEKIPGFNYSWLVDAIRLNVMDNFVDHMALGRRKQRRIFKRMMKAFEKLGSVAYIKPEPLENHEQMLAYCSEFVMTAEYDRMPTDLKSLIDRHIQDRKDMDASLKAQAAPPPAAGAPGPAPVPMPQVAAM